MKIEFDAEEVKRQLQRLHDALLADDVDIWIKYVVRNVPTPVLEYTVYVRERDGMESVCANDVVAAKAVDEVLAKAGPRGDEAKIRAKRLAVERARAELEKLESELDPLLSAIDAVKAQQHTNP
jgi:hypothetical protein